MAASEQSAQELTYVTFTGRHTAWGLPGECVDQISTELDARVDRTIDLAPRLDLDCALEPRRVLVLQHRAARVGLLVHGALKLQSVHAEQLQPVPELLRGHGAARLIRHIVLSDADQGFLGLDPDLLCALCEEADGQPA